LLSAKGGKDIPVQIIHANKTSEKKRQNQLIVVIGRSRSGHCRLADQKVRLSSRRFRRMSRPEALLSHCSDCMVDLLSQFFEFIRHLDVHLENIMVSYQWQTYFILALIIFCETGLVVTPFLPGDSLLFAAGAITAKTAILSIWLLIPLLFVAAILGDNTNYFFGRYLGSSVFTRDYWFIKRKYIEQTQEFYAKYGGQTLIMARFVPIVRTFAPFVAGVGKMMYGQFIRFCVAGGILWVTAMTLAGYLFGQIPIVKNNFEIVVFGIIGVSLLPMVYQVVKVKFGKKD
jgi:membrane-associated protein